MHERTSSDNDPDHQTDLALELTRATPEPVADGEERAAKRRRRCIVTPTPKTMTDASVNGVLRVDAPNVVTRANEDSAKPTAPTAAVTTSSTAVEYQRTTLPPTMAAHDKEP